MVEKIFAKSNHTSLVLTLRGVPVCGTKVGFFAAVLPPN